MRTHCATLRTRRRGPGLYCALCPLQEQVKAGGRQGGGSAVRVREGRDPRARSRSRGSGGRRCQRYPKTPTWGTGPPTRRPEPKGSEASARGGPWRKAGIQAKAGAAAVSSASQSLAGFQAPDTPLSPPHPPPGFVPIGSHKGLTSRPSEHLRHFSGRAFLELRANLQST